MSYLDRLKGINEKYLPMEATEQTAKIDLRGLCSSPIAQKNSISANDPACTAWRWLLHFENRNPLEVCFLPEATHGEVMAAYPAAIAAEPIEDRHEPGGALAAGDDAPNLVDDIPASAAGDERRFCSQCLNLRGGACIIAKPGGLVSAIVGYRPALPEMLQRCAGYSPNADDPDQRPGHERWPGLSNYPKGAK